MRLRSKIFLSVGIMLGVLVAGVSYVFLPFIMDEDRYRAPIETAFSFALDRAFTVKGPITLTLSWNPTLILENVHLANPEWASRSDFLVASRAEAQLSFFSLIWKEIKIDRVFLDGVDILLEEGPNDSDNWTFDSSPEAPQSSGPSEVSVKMSQESYAALQRVTFAYLPYEAEKPEFSLTIIEGTIVLADNGERRYMFRGTYHDVPFSFDVIGAPLMGLLDLDAPWPWEGSIQAARSTLHGKGRLFGAHANLSLELTGSLRGERLSDLGPLFQEDLPSYGPYELVTSLSYSDKALRLQNSHLKVGDSDLAGTLTLEDLDERINVKGTLTAQTLRIEDFHVSEPAPSLSNQTDSSDSHEAFIRQIGMEDVDIHLDLSARAFQYDIFEMQAVRLSAQLVNGIFSVTPVQGKVFGGRLTGNVRLDGNTPSPTVNVDAHLSSFNYGQALQIFGATGDVLGSTDLDLSLRGRGARKEEFLRNVTMTVNMGASDLVYGKEERSEVEEFGVQRATVRVSQGGPVKARMLGLYQGRSLDLRMATAPLAQFLSPSGSWPISFVAQGRQSTLTLKGDLKTEPAPLLLESEITLRGKRPSDLMRTLPTTEPYGLQATLLTDGSRITLSGVKGRLGKTDIQGDVQVDLTGEVPFLTARLFSRYFNSRDFLVPSASEPSEETAIPRGPFRIFNGDITWDFGRLMVESAQVRKVSVKVTLQDGRLGVMVSHGILHDWNQRFGEFQGKLEFDVTPQIPTLMGKVKFRKLDVGYIINGFQKNGPIESRANMDVNFSSYGTIVSRMLGRTTFEVTTHDVPLVFLSQPDESQVLAKVSNAVLSVEEGGPPELRANGTFNGEPFTIRSQAGYFRRLLKEIDEWPVKIETRFPQVKIDLNGHLLFPLNGEDFRFRMKVEGENITSTRLLSGLSETMSEELGDVLLIGNVAQTQDGYGFTDVQVKLGPNDVSGNLFLTTTGDRPKIVATLESRYNEFGFLTREFSPSLQPEDRTILKSIIGTAAKIGTETKNTVVGIGSKAGSVVTQSLGIEDSGDDGESSAVRIFPDGRIPIEYLRSIDLDLEWHVRRVQSKGFNLGHLSYFIDLNDGKLVLGPLRGELWRGAINAKITLDASQYVPTVNARLNVEGLDLGFLDDSVGVTDMISGKLGLIKLHLQSRGTTIHEILNRANGEATIIEDELEINNAYVDLWAADIFTLALSKAWEQEEVTKLNCAVGYFDIVDGEVQSDAILLDTKRITIGGFGTLNLHTEQVDLILTPKPKNPSLVNLSHDVRVSGPLSNPDVSGNKMRIAQGGGWYLLGLVNPIGFAVVVPKIAGTTMGTGKHNACEEAMAAKELTVKQVEELHEDWWDWTKRKITGAFSSEKSEEDPVPQASEGATP